MQGALGTNGLVEVLVVSCKAGSKAGRPFDCGGHSAFSELDWGNSKWKRWFNICTEIAVDWLILTNHGTHETIPKHKGLIKISAQAW